MKKISAILLILVLLFSSCSNNAKKTETTKIVKKPEITDKAKTPDSTEITEPEKKETTEEKTAEVEKPAPEPSDNEPVPSVEELDEQEIIAEESSLCGKVIVIDPGHGINSYSKQEPIAPGSSQLKAAFVSGTRGANQTEEQLNLSVGLKLKAALEEKGAIVYMTRETHECDVSNVERAQMANELNADIAIRIHADGADNSSAHGVSVLVPGNQYITDSTLISESRSAGEYVLSAFVEETGAQNRGISVRNDMTGFNWSTVPVLLVEMGFMTNPEEDRLMETEDYQHKMVSGMVNGLEQYFGKSAE